MIWLSKMDHCSSGQVSCPGAALPGNQGETKKALPEIEWGKSLGSVYCSMFPFPCLPFVRGGKVGSSLRRLARACAVLVRIAPTSSTSPGPSLRRRGDDGAWIASSRGCEIVLFPTGNQEAPKRKAVDHLIDGLLNGTCAGD